MEYPVKYGKEQIRISKGFSQAFLSNLEIDTVAHTLKKFNLYSNSKKGDLTEDANCNTISLILHANKIMLSIV